VREKSEKKTNGRKPADFHNPPKGYELSLDQKDSKKKKGGKKCHNDINRGEKKRRAIFSRGDV